MSIRIRCAGRGNILRAAQDKAGKVGSCPKCGIKMQIPSAQQPMGSSSADHAASGQKNISLHPQPSLFAENLPPPQHNANNLEESSPSGFGGKILPIKSTSAEYATPFGGSNAFLVVLIACIELLFVTILVITFVSCLESKSSLTGRPAIFLWQSMIFLYLNAIGIVLIKFSSKWQTSLAGFAGILCLGSGSYYFPYIFFFGNMIFGCITTLAVAAVPFLFILAFGPKPMDAENDTRDRKTHSMVFPIRVFTFSFLIIAAMAISAFFVFIGFLVLAYKGLERGGWLLLIIYITVSYLAMALALRKGICAIKAGDKNELFLSGILAIVGGLQQWVTGLPAVIAGILALKSALRQPKKGSDVHS